MKSNTDWLDLLNEMLRDHQYATLRSYYKNEESFPSTPKPVSPSAEETKAAIRETQKVNLK